MKVYLKFLWKLISAPFRFLFWLIKSLFLWMRGAVQNTYKFISLEPEESELPETIQKVTLNPASIFPHINALRKMVFRCLLVLMITTGFSFVFAQQIMEWLARPIGREITLLTIIDVTEPISVFMRVSLLSGFALALPYIITELAVFIGEGLRRNTRLFLVFFVVPASTLLFVGGMAFAYFVMLPVAVPFLLNILKFQTTIRASSYIQFVTGVMFWIGVTFEFPMVIFVIARLGWISAGTLAKHWRLAIILIAVIAALVTPTVDPVNMAIVMGPLIVLYFFSIGLAFIAQRGKKNT